MNNLNIWVTDSSFFFHQEVIYDPKFKLPSMFSVLKLLYFCQLLLHAPAFRLSSLQFC